MKLFKLILVLMVLVSIVPTAVVAWTSVSKTRELLVRDAQELAQERVAQLVLKSDDVILEPLAALRSLARPGFLGLAQDLQREQIGAVLSQRSELAVVTIFGSDGVRTSGLQGFAVKEIPPTEIAEHEARAAQLLAQPGSVRFSNVYRSPSRGAPVLTLVLPVDEPPRAFVAAELSLAGLVEMLSRERVGSEGFAFVVDSRGRLVAGPGLGEHPIGADLLARPTVDHLARSIIGSPEGAELSHVGNFGEEKSRVVGAYRMIPLTGWAVVSEQPIDLAYRHVETMHRQVAFSVAGGLAGALVLAALFSRTLSRPLKKFGAMALQIARGHYGVQVDFRSKNELGELAQTFNYMSAQIEAYDHETRRLYETLEGGYLETIVALANSIDSKDAYTRGHSQRVGDMAVELGRELGMTERELKLLHYGGILHDIGKLGIIDSILSKQSRLTEEEMVVMRDHPAIGDTIVQPISFLAQARAAIRSHHERWDGQGYPDQLKGDEIPLIARIVSCADIFDACTSTRPYQKAMSPERAWTVMEAMNGAQLDPQVLKALRRVLEKRGAKLDVSSASVMLAS